MTNAIIFDIHNTVLNKKGKVNKNIKELINILSTDYFIYFYTADGNFNENELFNNLSDIFYAKEKKALIFNPSIQMVNQFKNNDVDMKRVLIKRILKFADGENANISFLIDNNKKVLKMVKKEFKIKTLRYN